MRHSGVFAATFLVLSLLGGCAAIGPTSSPEFPRLVAKAIPHEDGEPQIFGSANWFPNTRGFTPFRSSLLARPADPIPGAIALTNSALIFLQWDEDAAKFDPIKRIKYSEIQGVSFDSWGAGRRLVLQKQDLSVDSFELTRAGGNLIDAAKVEEAFKFLQSHTKMSGG